MLPQYRTFTSTHTTNTTVKGAVQYYFQAFDENVLFLSGYETRFLNNTSFDCFSLPPTAWF